MKILDFFRNSMIKAKFERSLLITIIFSIPFFLCADNFAPLIPPGPEFPLGLSKENALIFEGPAALKNEQERILMVLSEHTFPWLFLIILIGVGGTLWGIYLLGINFLPKKREEKESDLVRIKNAFEKLRLKELKNENLKIFSTELSAMLIDTISLKLGHSMHYLTTNELKKALESRSFLSKEECETIISDLNEMDQIKFANKKPSEKELKPIFERMVHSLDQMLYQTEKIMS